MEGTKIILDDTNNHARLPAHDTDDNNDYRGICAVWDFRANDELYENESILTSWLKSNCKKYVFQKEAGDSGYVHWQGRFSLIKKRNKSSLMKLFKAAGVNIPNYLAPTATSNHQDSFFYALKADTRILGPFMDPSHKQKYESIDNYLPVQFRGLTLWPWQQKLLDDIDRKDYRVIDLIYDPTGNKGKSTIASICEIMHGCIDMPALNDFKELMALAHNICCDSNNRNPRAFFFDMPRACPKNALNGLFSAIEQIKKGKLYDTRYHYKSFWIDSPRVWVFSNVLPDMNMLSADRWRIWTINDKKELIDYHKLSPYSSDGTIQELDTRVLDYIPTTTSSFSSITSPVLKRENHLTEEDFNEVLNIRCTVTETPKTVAKLIDTKKKRSK